jgi:cytochrome o ubiquinol oxidase subunit II
MRLQYKVLISIIVGILAVIAIGFLLQGTNFDVLNSQGEIADKQRALIDFTILLSFFVVVPVFVLLFGIAWRFRAGNTKAKYRPNWDGNKLLETIWWVLPSAIIVVLSVVIWTSSHELDPYRPLDSDKKPVVVQVIALQWKWLFLYPEQGIATVNQLNFPVNTPVNFTITADAPMNSFWIPSLGGQVYAMSGMSTKLHLKADNIGSYNGSSANISGEGFAGMKFVAKATSQADFDKWVVATKQHSVVLDDQRYEQLVQPSKDSPVTTYVLNETGLYDKIVKKYMEHSTQTEAQEHDHGDMDMDSMQGMHH